MTKEVKPSPVFGRTYRRYLAELKTVDLPSLADRLGIRVDEHTADIPVFGRTHRVSTVDGVLDDAGKQPEFSVCVLLLKYLLLCPPSVPKKGDWVGFRDFKDAAPLVRYFSQNVQEAVCRRFTGRSAELIQAAEGLSGIHPDAEFACDAALLFHPLPRVPVLLLFNDADETFPAHCSLLFQNRAEKFLDPECLAIVGSMTAEGLCR